MPGHRPLPGRTALLQKHVRYKGRVQGVQVFFFFSVSGFGFRLVQGLRPLISVRLGFRVYG